MNEDASTRLLEKIAGSGLAPETWPGLLEDIATFAGARGVFLIPLTGDVAGLRSTPSLDDLQYTYVKDGWATNDYRFRAKAKMLRDGITVDQDIIDADAIRHEPFYDAFLRPLGLRYFAGLAIHSGPTSWALTLQRGVSAEPFGLEEQARLRQLVAPMQDAVRVGRALQAAYAEGSVEPLADRDAGCLLFDETGRVTFLNKVAERLVGVAIEVRQGIVSLASRRQSAELHRLIRQALQPPSFDEPSCSTPIFIGDPEPAYLMRVTRLPAVGDYAFRPYRGLIQIRPIHPRLEIDPALVQQAYGLTSREREALHAMLRFQGIAEAAKACGVTYETIRSQIKTVYAKTGTGSQIALVSKMASFLTRKSDPEV